MPKILVGFFTFYTQIKQIIFHLSADCRAVSKACSAKQWMLPPDTITLQAPIYNPEKLMCIGMNYVDHCTEQNVPVPVEPVVFSKFNSSITEPNGTVYIPPISEVNNYWL